MYSTDINQAELDAEVSTSMDKIIQDQVRGAQIPVGPDGLVQAMVLNVRLLRGNIDYDMLGPLMEHLGGWKAITIEEAMVLTEFCENDIVIFKRQIGDSLLENPTSLESVLACAMARRKSWLTDKRAQCEKNARTRILRKRAETANREEEEERKKVGERLQLASLLKKHGIADSDYENLPQSIKDLLEKAKSPVVAKKTSKARLRIDS